MAINANIRMKKEDLIECHNRIAPYIHRTPVLTSRLLNKIAGAALFSSVRIFKEWASIK